MYSTCSIPIEEDFLSNTQGMNFLLGRHLCKYKCNLFLSDLLHSILKCHKNVVGSDLFTT